MFYILETILLPIMIAHKVDLGAFYGYTFTQFEVFDRFNINVSL